MPVAAPASDVSALYVLHAAGLRQWLRRHTHCPHRAADIAQDTFCRLLERREAVSVRDRRRYLAAVARRLLIDDIRHREIERAYLAIHEARAATATR